MQNNVGRNVGALKMFVSAFAVGVLLITVICSTTNDELNTPRSRAFHNATLNIGEANKPVVFALNNDLPWWEGGSCSSTSTKLKLTDDVKGYCGYRSSALGKGQKVISYSLYGNYTEYATGLPSILSTIAQLYPGWVVKLHTDPRIYKDHLCPLLEAFPHFYICDVTNLPGPPYNYSEVDHMLWRVSPLGDEQVDVFLSRDIDAEVLPREADAVADFLRQDDSLLHVMRDHPGHIAPILGGTYGVRQHNSTRKRMDVIRRFMLRPLDERFDDQDVLAKYLFPLLRRDSVQHDCCSCQLFFGSVPFPTQRKDGQFVGNRKYRKQYFNESLWIPCPQQCRPYDHQDWKYC